MVNLNVDNYLVLSQDLVLIYRYFELKRETQEQKTYA
jgi:hypothetical protein